MKTSRTNENFVSTLNTANSQSFKIAEENQAFIIEALSKNIYRDPIGTIIREYSSNAWDANVEAGVNEPILVQLDSDPTGTFFSVTDYGVGLSPERVTNVFVKYGASTKGGDDQGIGGFGIGAKSAFAYTDTFFVNTVYDGYFYKYMLTKTSEKPEMILVTKEETDLANGTEIKIYLVNDGDKTEFYNKIHRQLLHFKNVVFRKDGEDVTSFIERSFYEGEGFEVASNAISFFSRAYALIGPVAYPIEYGLLNLSSSELPVPIGLNFKIGELDVTLSREEIRYTEETIKIIKQKIVDFKATLQKLYDNRIWELKNPQEYYKKDAKGVIFELDDMVIKPTETIKGLVIKKYTVEGVLPELKLPPNGRTPFLKIVAKYDGKSVTTKERELPQIDSDFIYNHHQDMEIYYNDEAGLGRNKLKYIFQNNGGKRIFIVKRHCLNYHDYKRLLAPNKKLIHQESNFFKIIMNFRNNFEDKIIDEFPSLSSVVIPKEALLQIREDNRIPGVVKIKGLKFNDIKRPFGTTYRKIRFDNDKVYVENNSDSYMLIKETVAFVVEKGMEQYIPLFSSRTYYNFFLRYNKLAKRKTFKEIIYIQPEKEGDEQLLKDAGMTVLNFKEYIINQRVPKVVKQYLVNKYLSNTFNTKFCDFLRTLNILNLKKQSHYDNIDFERIINVLLKIGKKFKTEDYISDDIIFLKRKISRMEKNFKMFSILKDVSDFDYEENVGQTEMLHDIYRKKGIMNSLQSYDPIFDWENDLLKESKIKQQYLQSLNK